MSRDPFENKDDFAADFEWREPAPYVQEPVDEDEIPSLAQQRTHSFLEGKIIRASSAVEGVRNDTQVMRKFKAVGKITITDSEGNEFDILGPDQQVLFDMPEGVDSPLPTPTEVLGVIGRNIKDFRSITGFGHVVVRLGSALGKSDAIMNEFSRYCEQLRNVHQVKVDIPPGSAAMNELKRLLEQEKSGRLMPDEFIQIQQIQKLRDYQTGKQRHGKGERKRNRKDRWRGKGGSF